MAVIVRKIRQTSLGDNLEEISYRSIKHPISKEDIKKAEELDNFLKKKMEEIENDLENRGLLAKKRGDLERWYSVGKHISGFIDDPSIVPTEDRRQDRYIWEALWGHAPLGVRPGPPNSYTGTARDHFRLSYNLAQIPYDVANRFKWSDWVNFLETPAVIDDNRITNWVWRKLPGVEREALRSYTRILRRNFRNRDLSVLDDDELETELENAWSETYTNSP